MISHQCLFSLSVSDATHELYSLLELEGALESIDFGALDPSLNPGGLRLPPLSNEKSDTSQTYSEH